MKRNLILIIVFITISFLLIGAASATNVGNISTKTVQTNSVGITSPVNSVNGGTQKTVSTNLNKYLVNSGANKFYWGERGGIFSYNWKTYRTSTGTVVIYVNYKTTTNSWKGTYTIKKAPKNKLKIVSSSPEIKLYSGHSSLISYVNNSLTPVKYYFKVVKKQIKSDGYFFV